VKWLFDRKYLSPFFNGCFASFSSVSSSARTISGDKWQRLITDVKSVYCMDLFLLKQTEEMESSPRLITLQFTWNKGSGKPIGSSFIGTSPEFELAVYTTMFLMHKELARVYIKFYDVELVCHRHGNDIGSAFPKSKSD